MSNFRDLVNKYFTIKPKDVEGLNNGAYLYYNEQLFRELHSLIIFDNLPNDMWDADYMLDTLYREGFLTITHTPLGDLPCQCGLWGVGYNNLPTYVNVQNHMFSIQKRTIGVDCELVYMGRNMQHYVTFNDVVRKYAMQLAQIDGSINTSLINSRVAHLFEATSKNQYKTLQKIYDDVSSGKPAVFMYNPTQAEWKPMQTFMNVKNTYIGNDLLITKRELRNEFLSYFGVPNANVNKRERLNQAEVTINEGENNINMSYIIRNLNMCFERVNRMFGTNIKARLNPEVYNAKKEVLEDEPQ